MTKLYFGQDVDQSALNGVRVALLGYGSQGRAQALNLRDSGISVDLGLRPDGQSWRQAEADGWQPQTVPEAVKGADYVVFLMPDMAQPEVFRNEVEPHLKSGMTLHFAHGFNIHYGAIRVGPGVDVTLVAPKGPGRLVRRQFEAGKGVPCLVAVQQDATGKALEKALAFAHAIGGTRAGVLTTTFAEETETDLFGEQAVLCGGATELVKQGFETLVAGGYQPEVAFFECLHELKLIVDLLYEGGFAKMHEFVSDTAKYGDLTRGPMVIDRAVRTNMERVLEEIRDGSFAREWMAESADGATHYRRLLAQDLAHPIEEVGQRLRARMSWLQERGIPQPMPQEVGP